MASNHRGFPIATNYRPTPRLAQLYAYRFNTMHPTAEPATDELSQHMINRYRQQRDAGWSHLPENDVLQTVRERYDLMDDMAESKYQAAMWSTPSPRDDDGRGDYLFDHPDEPERRI